MSIHCTPRIIYHHPGRIRSNSIATLLRYSGGGETTRGRGGGRGHTCDLVVYGRRWRRRWRRGSRPWSSRREETHGSRVMPATPVGARAIVTIARRGGQWARQTVLSTTDPTKHTLWLALDDPVDMQAILESLQLSDARQTFYTFCYNLEMHILPLI